MKQLAKTMFFLARTTIGALFVGFSFAHLTAWMPLNKIYETDLLIAFYHPRPTAKTHILLVPKRPIKTMSDLAKADSDILVEVYATAQRLVKQFDLDQSGYSIIINGGSRQDVMQIHWHLIAD